MIRLFVPTALGTDHPVSLTEKQAHYLRHVMRRRAGDEAALFNARDGEWLYQLAAHPKEARCVPVRQLRAAAAEEGPILCPAVIKKENMDWALQKAAELGASEIRPVKTARSAAHFNAAHAARIVQEAAEQCERLSVPPVAEQMPLDHVLKQLPAGIAVFYLEERRAETPLYEKPAQAAFFVGPEGGWTAAEIALLRAFPGARACSLGSRILRAETACVAVLAAWNGGIFRPRDLL